MNLDLFDMVNKEQLLDIALVRLMYEESNEECMSIVVWYCINEFLEKNGTKPSPSETIKLVHLKMIEKSLQELTKKGLVDYDFDTEKYSITEEGKQLMPIIKNDNQ